MADDLTKMDRFNLVVAFLFAQLLDRFPIRDVLDPEKAVEAAGFARNSDGHFTEDQEEFVVEAGRFLEAEGFLEGDPFDQAHGARLTSKALLILQQTPEGLREPGPSFGDRLRSSTETATINQVVSQIFGIAAGIARGAAGLP